MEGGLALVISSTLKIYVHVTQSSISSKVPRFDLLEQNIQFIVEQKYIYSTNILEFMYIFIFI